MALTDEQLLDFDASRIHDYDPARTREALKEQGDVFRAQLVAARWIQQWADGLEKSSTYATDPQHREGLVEGLREVAAHLRLGDLIPGGETYERVFNANE